MTFKQNFTEHCHLKNKFSTYNKIILFLKKLHLHKIILFLWSTLERKGTALFKAIILNKKWKKELCENAAKKKTVNVRKGRWFWEVYYQNVMKGKNEYGRL